MNLAIGFCLGFSLGVALMLGLGEQSWESRMKSMLVACELKAAPHERAYVAWRLSEGFRCAAVNDRARVWAPRVIVSKEE